MTYNIHQGFNAGQTPSLDALVDVVSLEQPDVLVLQEVVRGWMIDEQHDALGVLAERLAMPYVFGPNIGDLYGNAILSRFPMTDVKRVHFAVEGGAKHQPRGAVGRELLVVDRSPADHNRRQRQHDRPAQHGRGSRALVGAGDSGIGRQRRRHEPDRECVAGRHGGDQVEDRRQRRAFGRP